MNSNRVRFPYWLTFAIVLATAATLYSMGRVLTTALIRDWQAAL